MPNAVPPAVRKPGGRAAAAHAPGPDPRVVRTTRALGGALIALIQERDFAAITVQDILDRAGVGRTAFYAHYRNKHDVLYSSYEGLFAWLEPLAERPAAYGPGGARLFPVAEFLAHVAEAHGLVRALRRDGLLDDLWGLGGDYAARLIARRLDAWAAGAGGVPAGISRPLLARMLAGALVESMRWWHDHPAAATPAEVDAAFHRLALGVLYPPPGARRPAPNA